MRRVNEIFYSLQGEGRQAGTPCVFIRFSGCNLHCPFCDTDHTQFELLGDDEIAARAAAFGAPWIVLTGGEPALSIDADFIALLKERTGARIAIETNGTHPVPCGLDWIACSPKSGISGVEAPVVIEHADEIKVVDCGQPLDPYFHLTCRTERTFMYLQPCFEPDEERYAANRKRTVERILADPRWRLSPQLHRFFGIR